MPALPEEDVRAAATRLRGQLVHSPTIGSVLPAGGADVRWKADLVQPGGSGWFRGYHHLLLRSYGALPGVSFAGPSSRLLAAAVAARLHRLSFAAFAAVPLPEILVAAVGAAGGTLEVVADPDRSVAQLQRRTGALPLPGAEHPEVAAGIATAALELAAALPADCRVAYALAEVAPALRAGLAAAGRGMEVLVADPSALGAGEIDRVVVAVGLVHRLQLRPEGAAVLATAAAHPGGGPVGALVLE